MRFLWWLGYTGILVFAVLVVSRVYEYAANAYGSQAAWNGFMFLCVWWLMMRVEHINRRVRK